MKKTNKKRRLISLSKKKKMARYLRMRKGGKGESGGEG